MNNTPWTTSELFVLRNSKTIGDAQKALPKRTKAAIGIRANKLGIVLQYPGPKAPAGAWTADEIQALHDAPSIVEAVAALPGRTKLAIRLKAQEIGVRLTMSGPKSQMTESSVSEDLQKHDNAFWHRQHGLLSTKYDKLLKEQTVIERLVTHISELAPRSYTPLPMVLPSGRQSSGKPQSAVLMFSDTHIGKSVKPDQTLTFGGYNFDTFMARLKYLEESIVSIKDNHVTTEVPELVIAMLGDMLDGTLVHSNEIGQTDPIFNQFYCGAHAIAQFFRNLAPHFPKIRIYDVVGNHTRFQGQHRMPTKNRYSNFDNFLYALVRELVRDIATIEWKLDTQPYEIFDVCGFAFFCAHGDSLRGGDKTLGIPNHAVGRLVSTATQMFNKYGKKAPNYYLVGHLHRDIVLPHATGSFMVNGGFPGVDEFGMAEFFTPADPTQKFFFVHPAYGKTASYDISLKFAEVKSGPAPYVIPDFSMT